MSWSSLQLGYVDENVAGTEQCGDVMGMNDRLVEFKAFEQGGSQESIVTFCFVGIHTHTVGILISTLRHTTTLQVLVAV